VGRSREVIKRIYESKRKLMILELNNLKISKIKYLQINNNNNNNNNNLGIQKKCAATTK